MVLLLRVTRAGLTPFVFLFKGSMGFGRGTQAWLRRHTRRTRLKKHACYTQTNTLDFVPCPPHRVSLTPYLPDSTIHVHQIPPRKTPVAPQPHVLAHEVLLDRLH